MSEKLQQAIASIKSGNKQQGQQLLAQILQTEPNNEIAWLWMSAVVDEDKRKYCIERVLKINPNNEAAKQGLANLVKAEKKFIEHVPTQVLRDEIISSKHAIEEHLPSSSTKIVLRSSILIGIIWGILQFLIIFVIAFISSTLPVNTIFLLILGIQTVSGIVTGVSLLRKGVGKFFSITLGGAISGFVSGAVFYLASGSLLINNAAAYPYNLTPTAYLVLCGFMAPSITAIPNAITVWIPRLFINPNNQQVSPSINNFDKVRSTKNNTISSPIVTHAQAQKSENLVQPNFEIIQPPSAQNTTYTSSKLKFWINSTKKETTVFIFDENEMILAEITSVDNLIQVQEKLKQGIIPTDLLMRKAVIPHKNIENITKFLISLKVEYEKSGQKDTATIDCRDQETTNLIFEELQKRLGTSFEKSSKTVGASSFIKLFIIFAVILSGITAFLYYAALEVESGVISPTGSARTRGIINLLDLIGSSGVLCIGGIFLIVALALLIYLIAKPPIITELKPKNQFGIEKVKSIESISPSQPSIPVTEFKEKPNTEVKASSNALIGAALSDGIMAGLIAGLLSIPLPVISILTNREIYAQYGMYFDGFLLLFTGVLSGILFYGRKIGGGGAIALGGAFGGAIAGLISGLMLGYSQPDMFTETASSMNTDSITIYITFCGLIPSTVGAILGASTAWLPGIFMESNEELESPSIEKIKPSQQEIEKLDSVGTRFKQRMKARFVVAAVSIAIVLICSLCQALAN